MSIFCFTRVFSGRLSNTTPGQLNTTTTKEMNSNYANREEKNRRALSKMRTPPPLHNMLRFCPIHILPLQLDYSKLGPICPAPNVVRNVQVLTHGFLQQVFAGVAQGALH